MSSHYEKTQLLGSRVQLAGSQQKCRAEDMASLFSRGEKNRPSALLRSHASWREKYYILVIYKRGHSSPVERSTRRHSSLDPLMILHTSEPLILFIAHCLSLWPCYYGAMILSIYYFLGIFFRKWKNNYKLPTLLLLPYSTGSPFIFVCYS